MFKPLALTKSFKVVSEGITVAYRRYTCSTLVLLMSAGNASPFPLYHLIAAIEGFVGPGEYCNSDVPIRFGKWAAVKQELWKTVEPT